MHYNHHYFADIVAAPARLDAVFSHIQQRMSDIHRRQTWKELRYQLLVSGAQPCGTLPTGSRLPDTSRIDREASAIELYLGRLVAPDTMNDARDTILDALGGFELSQTAEDLVQLHQLCPAGATALLELRIGRGFRLLEAAKDEASPSSRLQLSECDHLISEMARIRVANMLRIIATDCAEQLHRPFGWAAVDDLEHPGTGGTLRIGTLIKRLRDEIKLATRAFDLYRRQSSSRSGSAALHSSSPRTAASLLRVSATAMAPFESSGSLNGRSCSSRIATRGQAFDWIMAQGGNPRFRNKPERPDLAAIIEALRS
ncbi:hypothetical protein [Sphingomonas sp. Mn802worker]|uniref:hypothetical protein n=1 Tax=Sphingomonas sp. Mn802worker TaxID=629773 RepID=UPI00036ED708|nr:hypothetical protein [Sphingomonas sp. Mn802worker]